MRMVSFVVIVFLLYCVFSIPSLDFYLYSIALIVWIFLMTALLSYKPPVGCSVLLAILGVLPLVWIITCLAIRHWGNVFF